jgi:formyl-CoA transferase
VASQDTNESHARPASVDAAAEASGGPLHGLRVLEIGSLIAGPFAGRLLGDFGAEVIKIELPGKPDPLREWGTARYRGRALWWPIQSRNKKLVTLDLRRGQGIFLDLVRRSDVVLENFRPGTLERWGVGFDAMREANPDIVLARVSGYGQTGHYSPRPGFAAVAEAMGGLRYLNGYPDQPPPRTGISLGDSLGALFATIGILAALHHRGAGGSGQVVDVALTESCLALLESVIPEYDRLGKVREPSGSRLEGNAPSNVFATKDEKLVVIAANQDDLFRRLCEAMQQPGLVDDPRFSTHTARGEHQDEIDEIVAAWARERTARELDELLTPAGVVCGPVYTVADLVADPHLRERGTLAVHDDQELGPTLGPGVVPRFSETPGSVRWSGRWEPGAHNDEVYRELLGLGDERLAELAGEGII